MTAQLIINRGGADTETVPLEVGARYLVGREAGDIVLGDGLCSSRHCELSFDGSALMVRDLGSTNGTFFAGARIKERALRPGESIAIGNCTLELAIAQAMTDGGTLVAMPAVTGLVARSSTPVATPAVAPPSSTVPAPAKASAPAKAPALVAKSAGGAPAPRSSKGGLALKLGFAAAGGAAALMVLIVVWVMSLRTGGDGIRNDGEATVKAVWFRGQPGGQVEGGTSPVVVRISRNTAPTASVGVMEEYSGGTGSQWRTATWVAAFNASRAAGVGLTDHEYLVRVGGHIDGPSAGMLITATMLALLRGDRIDPLAGMTGTINPDGSAGPVGGIVQKMQGAKASGLKRFGYPIGLRSHVDLSTGQTVDLHDYGAGLGLEVTEIADLAGAYQFMTGKVLPIAQPIDEASMQLDAETNQRLRAKLMAWKGRIDQDLAKVNDHLKRSPAAGDLQSVFTEINTYLNRASTLEKSDLPAAALADYATAAMLLYSTRESLFLIDAIARFDLEGIKAQLDAARAGAAGIAAFGNELEINARRNTVGGHVNLTRAGVAYVQALALAQEADAHYDYAMRLVTSAKDRRAAIKAAAAAGESLIYPLLFYTFASVSLDVARDGRDLAADEGSAVASNLDVLVRDARGYGSAAGATLDYFESLAIEPLKDKGMSIEQARAHFGRQEFGYPIVRSEVRLAEALPASITNPNSTSLLRMAAGIDAFLGSAALVNKYYSLGAVRDGDKITFGNRKALSSQLDLARTYARQAATRAQERAGFVPVAARIAYQIAGARREGDDEQKVAALLAYWESAQWSELAERLASPAM